MKKIISLILACVLIVTAFVGCSKESETVNNTADPVVSEESTTIATVDEAVDELTEDVSVENTTTDKDGNKVIVGTDKDGNTVEIKTEPDGKITKTVTDKDTGKKTEQTTKTTTVPSATKSDSSDKKPVTTAKHQTTKPQTTEKQTTTKKPASQQTTAHTHNWQPVYKTRKICVKEAYMEPVTATVPVEVPTYHCICGAWFNKTNCDGSPMTALDRHCWDNDGPNDKHKGVGYFTMEPIPGEYETITTGSISYPAVYKEEKYIASYKCSCGKTKSA